jgi:hypothetical protein
VKIAGRRSHWVHRLATVTLLTKTEEESLLSFSVVYTSMSCNVSFLLAVSTLRQTSVLLFRMSGI